MVCLLYVLSRLQFLVVKYEDSAPAGDLPCEGLLVLVTHLVGHTV